MAVECKALAKHPGGGQRFDQARAEALAQVKQLVLVCSGTEEEAAYEDMLGAGALADMVWPHFVTGHISDSAEIARQTYRIMQRDIPSAMQYARNGRRLLSIPQLKDDVHACVQRETLRIVAGMNKSGEIRVISSE